MGYEMNGMEWRFLILVGWEDWGWGWDWDWDWAPEAEWDVGLKGVEKKSMEISMYM